MSETENPEKIIIKKRGTGQLSTIEARLSQPPAKSKIISDLNPPKIQEYSRANQDVADEIIKNNTIFISTSKQCRQCQKTKPHTEFPYQKDTGDHLGSYCYVCKREREKLRYAKNKLKVANLVAPPNLIITK